MEESPPQEPPAPSPPAGAWPQGPPPGYDPSQYGAYPYGPPPGPYPYGPPHRQQGLPAWAIVLMVLGLVGPIMAGILAAIAIPMFVTQHDKAKDSSVEAGAHSIEVGIQTWAVDHGDVYPEASEVTTDGEVGAYMRSPQGHDWPTNPWTGGPMEPGTSRGDYRYEATPDGFGYELIVFLSNGEALKIH